ncbi:GAD-like domain-containing protein [Neorhizobium alkalisoli]|uniref:GAD-like domain-containing protein n=1 Tax=Neorhizobium alkalisoli TaxID=528178 RepID=UPI000CF90759|nr:GAD-like domain-containing protein [Neorhizobium alkalisoli]
MPYSDYEPLLAHARNLDSATPVREAEIAPYRGILPDGLLEFWARHGNQLVFGDGFVQMCDPATFAPVIRAWFEGDPEFDPQRLVVYAMGGFGSLYICDGTKIHHNIHTQSSEFTAMKFNPPPTGEDYLDFFLSHALKLGTVTPRYIDDDDLHTEAVAQHGPLSRGEMFTWVPALQMASVGNRIEKVDAEVQISILQDFGPLKYIADNFTPVGVYMGTEFRRVIGPRG